MAVNKSTSNGRNNYSGLQSTADAELTRLRMRLNKKREYIAILELELFNTRVAIHEFMQLYNERVGHLEVYLRTLRRKLYEVLEAQRPNLETEETFDPGNEEQFTYQVGKLSKHNRIDVFIVVGYQSQNGGADQKAVPGTGSAFPSRFNL